MTKIKKMFQEFMGELTDELREEGKKNGEKVMNKLKIKSSPFGLKYVDGWNDAVETIKQKIKEE